MDLKLSMECLENLKLIMVTSVMLVSKLYSLCTTVHSHKRCQNWIIICNHYLSNRLHQSRQNLYAKIESI